MSGVFRKVIDIIGVILYYPALFQGNSEDFVYRLFLSFLKRLIKRRES